MSTALTLRLPPCGSTLKYKKPRAITRVSVKVTKIKYHKKWPHLQMVQFSPGLLVPYWSRYKMDAAINAMIRTVAHSAEIVCSGAIIKRIPAGRLVTPNHICTNRKVFKRRIMWTGL